MKSFYNYRVTLILSGLFALILSIPALNSSFFDDAYIHARIVSNFLDFGNFSFNEGDVFKAGSSTGYLLMLSLVSLFFDPVVSIRVVQLAVIFVYVCCIIYASLRIFNSTAKVLIFTTLPFFLLSSYGGMETGIACVLFLVSTLSVWKNRPSLALIFAALAIFFRVEFLLFFTLLWIYVVFNHKFSFYYFISLAPLAALVSVDLFFYGDIIPHAANVKSVAYGHPLINSMKNAIELGGGDKGAFITLSACLFAFISCISIIRLKFELTLYHVCVLFSTGVLFAWAIGRSNIFTWYYPIFSTPFVLGVCLYFEGANKNNFQAGLGAIAAIGLIFLGSEKLYSYASSDGGSNLRVDNYLEIGEGLYELCNECTLMTSEIGGLGYGFRGVVYDAFGLGDPIASNYHPLSVPNERQSYGIGAIPAAYVAYRDPDFIVSMPVFTYQLRQSDLLNSYKKYICYFDEDRIIFGDRYIAIYSKESIPMDVLSSINCKADG